ncbi:hypothetical protein SEA_KIPPER29_71 [Mycobacterium phage Kipper29]|uniref:Gp68-like predicted RNA polymerase component domain-containing protein n=2 Tax=Gladiatorvirus ericB TaxID=1041406 RepID=G1EBU2_9CAUD|nr:hypothetical protein AXJ19_gp041 [Mycobacterium phage VohminGhazi]YP_009637874.1 hypothetical protein FGG32_gp039 [Mycobacterium phage EricB]AEK08512.1 hypothetical protein PBI_DAVINCI_69 [Mycobacterium phage DaVinci]AMW64420.1 hypothetical protein PBI_KAZAN_72 [Mycobacterium phage Kazan]AVR76927.1 hypothetical protein SEA_GREEDYLAWYER_68 [Mycobacterium phage GreedyLawyer]QDF15852.1 hypothetical protein SEA_KIPPER29_71 [Mycobacterium phage Kipper29]QXO14822.1 hypothetical protein SEA_SMELL
MADWNPDDKILKSPLAPHESAAVLRMHRAGHKGADTLKILKVRATKLMKQMQRALDEETRAAHAGRPIHDAKIDPKRAK